MVRVYLDYNATAPLRPEARTAMIAWLSGADGSITGNPSSIHAEGQRARSAVEQARGEVAGALGAGRADIVFTSGATEANNLALHSLPHPVAVSAVEHPSVLGARVPMVIVDVDSSGRLPDPELLVSRALDAGARSLSVMLANNETGNLYPIAEVAEAAAAAGLPMHCDATQAFGRLPVQVANLGPHLISVSSHKIGGPKGAGALWADPDFTLKPLAVGGHQERGRRGGTENVAALVGFGAAASAIDLAVWDQVARLRDDLWRRIQLVEPGARLNGDLHRRLPAGHRQCERLHKG